MRSLWFVRQGLLEWRDVLQPKLGGDLEALVQPIVASSCDIDRYIVGHPSPFTEPFAIGHNAVARVIDIGDEVKTIKPGDLVTVPWHINCGKCDQCRRGLPAYCRQRPPGTCYGLPTGDRCGGLFDDIVRVPFADAMLRRLPEGVDPVELVAASDNLAGGYSTVAPHVRTGKERLLVLGWGINGLYAVAFGRALGLSSITYVDEDAENRATAVALGAEVATSIERDMGPFDVVVDASVNPKSLYRDVLRVIEHEAVIECVGHLHDVAVDGWRWYTKGATFHCGLCNAGQHVSGVFDAVRRRTVIPSTLWSERVAWDEDLPAAFAAHRRQLVAVRT